MYNDSSSEPPPTSQAVEVESGAPPIVDPPLSFPALPSDLNSQSPGSLVLLVSEERQRCRNLLERLRRADSRTVEARTQLLSVERSWQEDRLKAVQLEHRVERAEQQNTLQNESFDQLRKQLALAQTRCSKLESDHEIEHQNSVSQNEAVQKEKIELLENIERLQEELNRKDDATKRLDNNIVALRKELEENVSLFKAEAQAKARQLTIVEENLEVCNERLATTRESKKQLQKDLQAKEKATLEVEVQRRVLQTRVEELQSLLDNSIEELAQQRLDAASHRVEASQPAKDLRAAEEMQEKEAEHHAVLREMLVELLPLEVTPDNMHHSLVASLDRKQRELSSCREKLRALEAESITLKHAASATTQELDQLRSAFISADEQSKLLGVELQETKLRAATSERRLGELEQRLSSEVDRGQAASTAIASAEQQLAYLLLEKTVLTSALVEHGVNRKRLSEQIAKKVGQLEPSEEFLNVRDLIQQNGDLKREVERLRSDRAAEGSQLAQQMRMQLEAVETEKKRLMAQHTQLTAQMDTRVQTLEEAKHTLGRQLSIRDTKIEELSRKIVELSLAASSDANKNEATNDAQTRNMLEKTQSRLEVAQEEAKSLRQQLDSSSSRVATLTGERDFYASSFETESNRLSSLRDEIRSLGEEVGEAQRRALAKEETNRELEEAKRVTEQLLRDAQEEVTNFRRRLVEEEVCRQGLETQMKEATLASSREVNVWQNEVSRWQVAYERVVEELQTTKTRYQEELQEMKRRIDEERCLLGDESRKVVSAERAWKDREEEIADKTREVARLESRLAVAQEAETNARKELDVVRRMKEAGTPLEEPPSAPPAAENKETKERLERLNTELAETQQLVQQWKALAEKRSEDLAEVENLRKRLAATEEQLAAQDKGSESIEALEQEKESLKIQIEQQKADMESVCRAADARSKELEERLTAELDKRNVVEKMHESAQGGAEENMRKLRTAISAHAEDLKRLQAAEEAEVVLREQMTKEREEAQDRIRAIERTGEEEHTKVVELTQEVDSVRSDLSHARAELNALQKVVQGRRRLSAPPSLTQGEETVEASGTVNADVLEALTEAQRHRDLLLVSVESLRVERDRRRGEEAVVAARLAEAQKALDERSILTRELESQLASLRAQINPDVYAENVSLQSKVSSLLLDLSTEKAKCREIEGRLSAEERKLFPLRREVTVAQNELRELRLQRETAEGRAQTWEQQNIQLQETIKKLHVQCEDAKSQAELDQKAPLAVREAVLRVARVALLSTRAGRASVESVNKMREASTHTSVKATPVDRSSSESAPRTMPPAEQLQTAPQTSVPSTSEKPSSADVKATDAVQEAEAPVTSENQSDHSTKTVEPPTMLQAAGEDSSMRVEDTSDVGNGTRPLQSDHPPGEAAASSADEISSRKRPLTESHESHSTPPLLESSVDLSPVAEAEVKRRQRMTPEEERTPETNDVAVTATPAVPAASEAATFDLVPKEGTPDAQDTAVLTAPADTEDDPCQGES